MQAKKGYVAIATLIFTVSITTLLGSLLIALQQNIALTNQQRQILDVKRTQIEYLEAAIQEAWSTYAQRQSSGAEVHTFFYTEASVEPNLNIVSVLEALPDAIEANRNVYGLAETEYQIQIEKLMQ